MVKRKANSSPVQDTFEATELPVNIVVVKCGLAAKIIKDNATLPLDVTAFDRQCCNCSKIHQVCLCIETKKGSIYWCAECRSNAIYNKIQQDVREMSSLFVEASIYIHYSLKKRWQNGNFEPIKFSDYYYPLMQKKRVDKYILDADNATLATVHIDQIYLSIQPINVLPSSTITFGCMPTLVYVNFSNILRVTLEKFIERWLIYSKQTLQKYPMANS